MLNECTKYGFQLVNNKTVSKENLLCDGVHLDEIGKVIIENNLIDNINNFFRSCKFSSAETLTKNYFGEKCSKDLCSDSLDIVYKAGDSYGYSNQQDNGNSINVTSLNPLLKIKNLRLSNVNRVIIDNLNINSQINLISRRKLF